jgi:hypothetical protein
MDLPFSGDMQFHQCSIPEDTSFAPPIAILRFSMNIHTLIVEQRPFGVFIPSVFIHRIPNTRKGEGKKQEII